MQAQQRKIPLNHVAVDSLYRPLMKALVDNHNRLVAFRHAYDLTEEDDDRLAAVAARLAVSVATLQACKSDWMERDEIWE